MWGVPAVSHAPQIVIFVSWMSLIYRTLLSTITAGYPRPQETCEAFAVDEECTTLPVASTLVRGASLSFGCAAQCHPGKTAHSSTEALLRRAWREQVADPRARMRLPHTETFERWWDAVCRVQRAAGMQARATSSSSSLRPRRRRPLIRGTQVSVCTDDTVGDDG